MKAFLWEGYSLANFCWYQDDVFTRHTE